MYLPGYSYDSDYNELQFAKYSNWDEFIQWYLGKGKDAKSELILRANRNPGAANFCRWVYRTVLAGIFWDGVKWVKKYVTEKEWVCDTPPNSGGTFPPNHWNQRNK